jgi:hypothetical protein
MDTLRFFQLSKEVCFEENVSTQQCKEKKNLRFLVQNEHKGRQKCVKEKEKKRASTVGSLAANHFLYSCAFPRRPFFNT